MSSLKWFNNLLVMENLLGVYRSYSNQTKMKRHFIIFQVFVQTVIHTAISIRQLKFLLGGDGYNQINVIYSAISTSAYVNSVSTVITCIGFSRAFVSYLRSMSRVADFFKYDNILITSHKRIYRFSISFTVIYLVIAVFRSLQGYVDRVLTDPLKWIPVLSSQTILKFTIIIQHLMFFVVVMILISLAKCVTSLISVLQDSVQSCDEHRVITSEQIQECVNMYTDLANGCRKVSICFGRQFLFSLSISILHYILMTYQMFYANALNIDETEEYKKIIIVICTYMTVTILPLFAGQKARNQGMKFHRALARLYNTIIIIEPLKPEAKLVKDFILLMKKNPLEIKLTSKIPVGMYILPVILTLAVNSVIVMLQFNHII